MEPRTSRVQQRQVYAVQSQPWDPYRMAAHHEVSLLDGNHDSEGILLET